MKYEIVDNFLNKEEFLKIKNYILSGNFPWYFQEHVSTKNSKDGNYFTHMFYVDNQINSDKFFLIKLILNKLKIKSLIRVKGNFYNSTNKIIEHEKHIDYNFKHKGFIFYVNNNDGFTKLKDGTIIESIENRGLFFDSSIEHNSSTCTDQIGRININFNYF
jgi:hypothetical protein